MCVIYARIIVKENMWVRERAQGFVGEVIRKVELVLNFKQRRASLLLGGQ